MSHFVGAKAMQAKQQSLLKRVDVLDQECEELHGQMVEWRDKHRDLQLQLQQMSEGKEQVQALLAEQQVWRNSYRATISSPSSLYEFKNKKNKNKNAFNYPTMGDIA